MGLSHGRNSAFLALTDEPRWKDWATLYRKFNHSPSEGFKRVPGSETEMTSRGQTGRSTRNSRHLFPCFVIFSSFLFQTTNSAYTHSPRFYLSPEIKLAFPQNNHVGLPTKQRTFDVFKTDLERKRPLFKQQRSQTYGEPISTADMSVDPKPRYSIHSTDLSEPQFLKKEYTDQPKSKRGGDGCMFHAGLAHNCDYRSLVKAFDDVDHWNSYLSPGKRKRSDASNWLRSKRHFPESWRQKLKKMPEAMPLIKVDHKRNTEESNDGGDIIVNDLIQQNNEEKERAVKDRY